MKNNTLYIFTNYFKSNISLNAIVSYYIVSVIIKRIFDLDIMIPCLWKSIFGINCPGCGLSRAGEQLLLLDFYGAYQSNPIIYILVPFFICYTIKNFIEFRIKNNA